MKSGKMRMTAIVLSLSVLMGTAVTDGTSMAAKKKTVKLTCQVVAGGSILLPKSDRISDANYSVKVSDKSVVGAEKDKESAASRAINPGNVQQVNGVVVTGKSAGIGKVTVKTKKKKYIYTVTVLDPEAVRAEAAEALAPELEKAKSDSNSRWAYTDLNGDGIEDLFVDGTMIGYDYIKKSTVSRKTGINLPALGAIYTSKENKTVYFEAVTGSAIILEKQDPDEDFFAGDKIGMFFVFDEGAVFDNLSNYYVIKYAHPEKIIKKKYYDENETYTCLNDPTYDQDDLWYECFDTKLLNKKMKTIMPDKAKVDEAVGNV
ncbi:MAG: hypothetical protein IKQ97_04715 [Eubacterium sp.]|nr:hypothetical protein [Eubacterium sp.]